MSDPERALSLVKLLPVERISATSAVEEVREGLWSTNIHETFILAQGDRKVAVRCRERLGGLLKSLYNGSLVGF